MALSDTNLVVRYYLDEAASGTSPSTLQDAGPNNIDLTMTDPTTIMSFTEVSGNRGVQSTSNTGDQRLKYAISDGTDTFKTALGTGSKFTIEVVMQLTSASTGPGRIFGINGSAGENGTLILVASSETAFSLRLNDNANTSHNFNPGTTSRMVLHAVLDTTQATEANRVKFAVNGGAFDLNGNAGAVLNSTLSYGTGHDLTAFNRANGGGFDRSWTGTLFYAALYNDAFDSTRVVDHYTILTADDDTPGGSFTPRSMLLGVG